MEQYLKQLKEAAWEKIKTLNLDDAVRTVSRSGKYDGTANYYAEISCGDRTLIVSSTSGAGTNSASVRFKDGNYNDDALYNCSDYGGHLWSFKDGDWVEVILKAANQESIVQQATQQTKELRRIKGEIEKFLPID